MDLRRAFTACAYLLVLTGILSLSIAEGSPGIILGATAASFFAFHRAERAGRAISRVATNLLVALVVVLLPLDYMWTGDPVVTLTHFLLAVQVVMLFGKKRPRDYLFLFTISLIHLGVAAVLTIELLFSVAFVVYMIVGTWTLVLFLLVRELDARAPAESAHVGGGRRLLSTTAGISVMTLALTVVFFFAFPRISAKLFDVSRHHPRSNMTGFTDQIGLDDLSSIRENPEVVLTVTPEGMGRLPPYPKWRGLAFDRYEEGRWSRSWHRGSEDKRSHTAEFHDATRAGAPDRSVFAVYRGGETRGGRPDIASYTVLQAPLGTQSSALFGAPAIEGVEFLSQDRPQEPVFDAGDSMLGVGLPATTVKYRVRSLAPRREDAAAVEAPPGGRVGGVDYLQLPAGPLAERIAGLARDVVDRAGARRPNAECEALERYLQGAGGFNYTLDLGALEPAPRGVDPIEHFLFTTKQGHCELSATAFVLMCRTLGLPARLVNGFQTGQWNEMGGWWVVRQMEAHAWAEVYFGPQVGWVDFDPTPWGTPGGGGLLGWLDKVQDYMRTRWLNYVISYTLSDQLSMAEKARREVDRLRTQAAAWLRGLRERLPNLDPGEVARIILYLLGMLAVLVALVAYLYTRRVRGAPKRAAPRRARPVPFWEDFVRALEKRGVKRLPSETPLELVARAARTVEGVPLGALAAVADAFYRVRFGEEELAPEARARVEEVLAALAARGPHRKK